MKAMKQIKQMKKQKESSILKPKVRIDVQSTYDEQCIEFNSYEDEKEVLSSLIYVNEKSNDERWYNDEK